jgi:hypothetical protein
MLTDSATRTFPSFEILSSRIFASMVSEDKEERRTHHPDEFEETLGSTIRQNFQLSIFMFQDSN